MLLSSLMHCIETNTTHVVKHKKGKQNFVLYSLHQVGRKNFFSNLTSPFFSFLLRKILRRFPNIGRLTPHPNETLTVPAVVRPFTRGREIQKTWVVEIRMREQRERPSLNLLPDTVSQS